LLPHLQRAVRLTIRLENAGIDHQAALEGLDRAHSATIVVDGHGAILFATRLAEAMLRRGDGVRAANGRLTCAGRAASDRLHRLIANAVGSPSLKPVAQCGGVAIEREDGRPPLTLLVAPFRPGGGAFGAPAPAALVLLRDLETSGMETEILRDLFGFTAAQGTVAARLCNGDSVEEIAAALRITLYTARDHMKAIFLKTGCCRQSQVVALLTRSVAALGVASPPPHLPHQGEGT
jgi:DNA-binding CsgD family transcriptional regulator